jgi:hypothetical protein
MAKNSSAAAVQKPAHEGGETMTISMYQASVPVFSSVLKNLSHVLAKGETHAKAQGLDPVEYLSARLAPDMHPLVRQVQIATDHAKGAPARLAGKDILKLADEEASFADLQARIATVRDLLKAFRADEIDGSEDKPILIKAGPMELNFTGQQYLLNYALQNFYFHVVTAYGILRHKGVPLGKGDFFGRG